MVDVTIVNVISDNQNSLVPATWKWHTMNKPSKWDMTNKPSPSLCLQQYRFLYMIPVYTLGIYKQNYNNRESEYVSNLFP